MQAHSAHSMKTSLFIGDLALLCAEADIYAMFQRFDSEILDIKIMRDEENGNKSLGYGFIKFSSAKNASDAIRELNGVLLCGRPMKLNWASYKTKGGHSLPGKDNKRTEEKSATSPVHVSFISFQIEQLVTEQTLRMLFSEYGHVIDASIKKIVVEKENRVQKGYGFVHYMLNAEGVNSAMEAVKAVSDLTIDKTNYKASVSHTLRTYISGEPVCKEEVLDDEKNEGSQIDCVEPPYATHNATAGRSRIPHLPKAPALPPQQEKYTNSNPYEQVSQINSHRMLHSHSQGNAPHSAVPVPLPVPLPVPSPYVQHHQHQSSYELGYPPMNPSIAPISYSSPEVYGPPLPPPPPPHMMDHQHLPNGMAVPIHPGYSPNPTSHLFYHDHNHHSSPITVFGVPHHTSPPGGYSSISPLPGNIPLHLSPGSSTRAPVMVSSHPMVPSYMINPNAPSAVPVSVIPGSSATWAMSIPSLPSSRSMSSDSRDEQRFIGSNLLFSPPTYFASPRGSPQLVYSDYSAVYSHPPGIMVSMSPSVGAQAATHLGTRSGSEGNSPVLADGFVPNAANSGGSANNMKSYVPNCKGPRRIVNKARKALQSESMAADSSPLEPASPRPRTPSDSVENETELA